MMPRPTPTLAEKYLTAQALAELLSVKTSWIYDKVQSRDIPHYRLGGRLVRFDPSEVSRWLNTQRIDPW